MPAISLIAYDVADGQPYAANITHVRLPNHHAALEVRDHCVVALVLGDAPGRPGFRLERAMWPAYRTASLKIAHLMRLRAVFDAAEAIASQIELSPTVQASREAIHQGNDQ